MIGRTWDKQIATYPSQPDGPLKRAGGYVYIYMYIYIYILKTPAQVIAAPQTLPESSLHLGGDMLLFCISVSLLLSSKHLFFVFL